MVEVTLGRRKEDGEAWGVHLLEENSAMVGLTFMGLFYMAHVDPNPIESHPHARRLT